MTLKNPKHLRHLYSNHLWNYTSLPPCSCPCIWGEGTLLTCRTRGSRGAWRSSLHGGRLVGDRFLARCSDRCPRLCCGGWGQLEGAPCLPATPADCICCASVASVKHCEVSAAGPCRRGFAAALSSRSWRCLCVAPFWRRFLNCDPLAVFPVIILCRHWAGGREIWLFPAQIPVCDAVCRLPAHHLSS